MMRNRNKGILLVATVLLTFVSACEQPKTKRKETNKQSTLANSDILVAAKNGNIEVVQSLLAKDASINVKTNHGFTAFMIAAEKGYIAIVEALLAKGADINAKTDNGITALMLAAGGGHANTVKLLLAKGADVNAQSRNGTTALMKAVARGDTAIVKALLDGKADLNMKSSYDDTAIEIAIRRDHEEIINLLKTYLNDKQRDVIENKFAEARKEKRKKEKIERKERIEKQFSLWDGSHRNLERIIKESMNDPDSYKHVKTLYRDMGDYLIVETTFRGKNAFGGVVKNTVKAKISLNGTILTIISQEE